MKVKLFSGAAVALAIVTGAAMAQSNTPGGVCFGASCGDEPNWNFYAPGNNAFDQAWLDYGQWRGFTAKFHIDESSVTACLNHCVWHAQEAEDICRASNPYNGIGVCNETKSEVYNECATQCTLIPH